MADLHNAFIQHLRKQPRGAPGPSPPRRMTCPFCRKESEAFVGNDGLFSHVAAAHPPKDPSSWDSNTQLKFINDAYQTTQEIARNASTPASPARSGSKASDLEGLVRQSSVKAEPGSRSPSRSPSAEEMQDSKLSSKRPYQADAAAFNYPLKHPPGSGPLRPEDVDPDFKRSSSSGPTNTPHPKFGSRKLYDPGPSPIPTPQQRVGQQDSSGHGTTRVSEGPNVSPTRTGTNPGHATSASIPSTSNSRPASASSNRHPGVLRLRYNPQWPTLVLQPESRDISQEQLAAEVKSIYTGLTMVETKCIHIDKAQQATPRHESRITDEHWQAMIALHRTLLHEHHDFFLASQHPSASPALKRLALKYSMPARMWKHGIHSFLELLRHRLPESLEYMLAFIYLAYQMMALLYETVGTFRNTWIECLGDLGRYRMAVEDEDVRDRDIWAGVARSWYNKAADTNPAIGRLFHHLAILARPNMVQQLYLYNRSLTSIMPFTNARESIVTIFDPVLSQSPQLQISHSDASLIKVHALLFKKKDLDAVRPAIDAYTKGLSSAIGQAGDKWRELGAFTAIANVGALFDFGSEQNSIRFFFDRRRKMIQQKDPKSMPPGLPEDQSVPDIQSLPHLDFQSRNAHDLTAHLLFAPLKVALSRRNDKRIDKNVLSFVHVISVFLLHLTEITDLPEPYVRGLLDAAPWNELASFTNTIIHFEDNLDLDYKASIVFEEGGRPLPEDWMLRGLSWSFEYCPRAWFKDAAITEEEERYMELTSTMKARVDRTLSLAVQLAKNGDWIHFNPATSRFSAAGQEDVEMVDDSGYESDSRQMKEIQEEDRSETDSTQTLSAHRAAILRTEYGTIVPNLDVLKQPELVNIMLDHSNMAMVIPHECMAALLDSANAHDVSSNEAAAALHNIRNALNEYKNITIQDANDQDLTRFYVGSLASFFSERPPQQGRGATPGFASRPPNVIRTLDAIARQNSDPTKKTSRTNTGLFSRAPTGLSEYTSPTVADEMDVEETAPKQFQASFEMADDRPAVVITDDRKVRAQVSKLGSAALAGWMVKKWLTQAKKSHEAREREASTKPMDVDPKTDASTAT